MAGGKKFYVVWEGRKPGVYSDWKACKEMVSGFKGASFMGFPSLEAAKTAFRHGKPASLPGSSKAKPSSSLSSGKPSGPAIQTPSIAVDAACSGNPGIMEYKGVDTATGSVLFHRKYPLGTNNIGEFLGLVHGLAYLKQHGSILPLYTDSVNAMAWIRQKRCKTTLKENEVTRDLFETIRRAETWLAENTWSTEILKWNTECWGENPADFGRK